MTETLLDVLDRLNDLTNIAIIDLKDGDHYYDGTVLSFMADKENCAWAKEWKVKMISKTTRITKIYIF